MKARGSSSGTESFWSDIAAAWPILLQSPDILGGSQKIRTKPLDERLIQIIESLLGDPIYHTQHIAAERYHDKAAFRQTLKK